MPKGRQKALKDSWAILTWGEIPCKCTREKSYTILVNCPDFWSVNTRLNSRSACKHMRTLTPGVYPQESSDEIIWTFDHISSMLEKCVSILSAYTIWFKLQVMRFFLESSDWSTKKDTSCLHECYTHTSSKAQDMVSQSSLQGRLKDDN